MGKIVALALRGKALWKVMGADMTLVTSEIYSTEINNDNQMGYNAKKGTGS
ncbi:hypothetical protein [Bartonella koehlerae]|uniref:Uncharacterized protein n=1 Tax=Bartonella koehlerae C-29 TaxID=1134510 RepID=A0A067WD41_9HYPH|nr:hypothetical protein [Bartonella koehlerae]KEC54728.1 hypothetical protein O9A_01342 [Bartonella koehlerae C-29]